MKNKIDEMNMGIISGLKRMRLLPILICLCCSAIWILSLKNSIANKRIYLFCVILALVSTVYNREIKGIIQKAFGNKSKPFPCTHSPLS